MTTYKKLLMLYFLAAASGCTAREDLKFIEVLVGRGGPAKPGAELYINADKLNRSWLSQALSPPELESIRLRTDFSKQSILLLAAGERSNFSGKIRVSGVYQVTSVKQKPLNVVAKIGVVEAGCQNEVLSRPYVVLIIERPTNDRVDGFDIENFDDDCVNVEAR